MIYRLSQLWAALFARIKPEEQNLLAQVLEPGEVWLFERMPRFDRRHSLDVYWTLVRAGHSDVALLKAALLHDCGKVAPDGSTIPLLYYGIIVILKALAPQLYQRAAANGRGVFAPIALHAIHERQSVALLTAAASDPLVIAIVEDYAGACILPATRLLKWADDLN